MQKLQDFAKIVGVEIPDGLKEANRTQDNRGNWRTAVRIVVEFQTADNMTDKQRELYARASEEQKRIMDANKTRISYSGLFNAENILQGFSTPENGCTDEQQLQVLAKVKETFAKIGNTAIFTNYEFGIDELTDNTLQAVYTDNGTKLTSRSRLFFEFFDNDEAAKRMLKTSLSQRIDNGELFEENPTGNAPAPAAGEFKI